MKKTLETIGVICMALIIIMSFGVIATFTIYGGWKFHPFVGVFLALFWAAFLCLTVADNMSRKK